MRQSTKEAIAEALLDLLSDHTIEQITVKKLVEECGVNRQTFYYHFCDIYDLLEWALGHSIELYLVENPFPSSDWRDKVRHLFHFLYQNRRKILHAYDQENRKLYERFIIKMIRPIIEEKVDSIPAAQKVPPEKRKFVLKIFVWLYSSLFFEWLEEGMHDENLTQLEDYFTVAEGGISAALEKFLPE